MESTKRISLSTYLCIALGFIIIALMVKDCKGETNITGLNQDPYPLIKTDSLYKKEYYALKEKYDKRTPPSQIILWDTIQLPGKEITKIEYVYDPNAESQITMTYVDSTFRVIKEGYFTQYPDASKLIEFNLSKDSLDITLLKTDATFETKKYPIYLDNFNYQWYSNELHNDQFKTDKQIKRDRMKWNQLYFNGGYSLTDKAGLVGLEYNLLPGRFKIDLETNFTVKQNTNLNLNAKVGYLLFK